MDSLKLFLKENRIKKGNVFYKVTDSVKDENGETASWEIRHITTHEDEKIREECTIREKGTVRIDYGKYLKKLMVQSVVYPPLYNAALQDSYGVKTPEDLLTELIDNPGEYQEFVRFLQKINGFDVSMAQRVDEAKN